MSEVAVVWNNPEECLPKEGELVFVYVNNKIEAGDKDNFMVYAAKYDSNTNVFYSGEIGLPLGWFEADEVLYWMSLPEKYVEGLKRVG